MDPAMRDELRAIAALEHRTPPGLIRALIDERLDTARRQGAEVIRG
jgi:hypothetical protein